MQPFVQIIGGGSDLTGGLGDRLLSVECFDEAEDKSDRVSIEIDDRAGFADGGIIDFPVIGLTVEIIMGYRDGQSASRGTYLIDDLTVSSPPRKLMVTGRSAAMAKSYRTPRTESYHQKTLGELMEAIASRNGYEPAVDPELSGIVIRHTDQHNESDMAFATRIAEMHDGVAKPVAGKLAVAKRGTGKNIAGEELPVITIRETDCDSWDFKYSAREEAGEAGGMEGAESGSSGGGVRAKWTDIRTGETKLVTAGEAPFHDLRFSYHNEAEAVAAVSQKRNTAARGKASFSCTIGGRVDVQAEAKLILASFRPYIPLEWRIKSCSHRIEGVGYTTDISAELFEEKQDDIPGKVKDTKPSDDDKIDKDAPAESVKPRNTSDSFVIDLPKE
ncbi:late control protein [Neorhizobium sp. T786]|uniref:phage late control D family protein n=1 Tax=Pseudorhizobium xiangyangii TaxID=2883104 RepID=UPI001CFFD085|nr:contractile injection system protein, VgrG/Pvc8 family [Neorhizobium xiangyangii]MCB5201734.1 late control protein [Neorhizobium xiangyangii]